jgi:hypothetical protein
MVASGTVAPITVLPLTTTANGGEKSSIGMWSVTVEQTLN